MTTYFQKTPATSSQTGLPAVATATVAATTGSISTALSGMKATFTLNVTSAAGVVRVDWDLGDGSKGFGTKVVKTYSRMGSYAVSAVITDKLYRKVTVTTTVKVIDGGTVVDLFNRANSTTSLGTASDGPTSKTWAVLPSGSTFGVVNNAAKITGGTATSVAYVDVGATGGVLRADIATLQMDHSRGVQLVFRFVDIQNYFMVQSYFTLTGYCIRILKKVANANTELYSIDASVTIGDQLKVTDDGTNIAVYLNGFLLTQTPTVIKDTALNTATKVGMGGGFSGDPTSGFDNFAWSAS